MRKTGAVKQDTSHRAQQERPHEPPPTPDEVAQSEWETEGGAPTGVGASEAATPESGKQAPSAEGIDYRDRWLRAEAELQNFRRRAQRDAEDARRRAEEAVLLDLVGLLDDLERALEVAGEGGARPAWVEGVRLVLQKGRDYLSRQGVAVVDPAGEPFDPTYHEAILEVDPPTGAAPGTVVQVVQKGYRRGERSLRAARVVVARANAS
jgi:molecular chaperone GrpE